MTRQRDGLTVAWLAFVGGTAASVAANIAHARLLTTELGPQIAAAFWPLALLGAIEVITRVAWPTGKLWTFARFGGTGAVALGAALLSYRHMASLLEHWGEDAVNAHVGPLVVDGLMVVAGTALLAMSKGRKEEPEAVAAEPEEAPEWPTVDPEPAAEPPQVDPEPVPPASDRELAMAEVRRNPDINGRELGDMFGKTDRWGRQIKEAVAKETAALATVRTIHEVS